MLAGPVLEGFRTLPFADAAAIVGGACVILAPHPDDESLGCGGLIAELCALGTPPVVVILTDGAGSHPNSRRYPPARLAALRAAEVAAALRLLGLPPGRLHHLGASDSAAPHGGLGLDRLADRLASMALEAKAATVLTTWPHDPHCDHLAAWHVAASAAKRAALRLLCYPVWGWTLPPDTVLPDRTWTGWRLDISGRMAAKAAAIAAHASQLSSLIDDDPTGFRLPEALLGTFRRPYEVFLEAGE